MTRVAIAWPTPTLMRVPVTDDTDSADTPTVEAPTDYEDLAAAVEKIVRRGRRERRPSPAVANLLVVSQSCLAFRVAQELVVHGTLI